MFINRHKSADPFLLFAVLSFLSSLLLSGIICKHCKGYSIGNIQSHISLTLSVSLFSTFIPLVFAAITYCKTRLSQIAPEIFSDLSLGNKIKSVWLILGALFVLSLVIPLMAMEDKWYVFLQLLLIFWSFVLSSVFIWQMLEVAKYSNLLLLFGITARKELKGQILKYSPEENANTKNRMRHIIEDFIGMANAHIRRGSREDLEITLKELQLYICSFFELVDKNLAGIRNPTAYHPKKEIYEILRKIKHLEDLHKAISDLLYVELSKLIHGISNIKEEKYLESFIPLLRAVISNTLTADIGYHSIQWCDFISETVTRTAVLKNTTYPNDAIDLYKEFMEIVFRSNPDSAVYTFCPRLHGLLKILTLLKSKEMFFKMWYSGLQARVIDLMLSLLPMCAKYSCNNLIVRKWAESITEVVSDIYLESDNVLMGGNPVSHIIQTFSPNSLPFVYQRAVDIIFSSDFDNQIKLSQFYTLTPVYSIYCSLIGKDRSAIGGELVPCLSSQFYIDLQVSTKITEEIDYWIKDISKEYKRIFEGFKNHYISKRNRMDIFELGHVMSIPAIALTANQENQIKLANEIVIHFADMLISMFNENTPPNANGWERAYILLLSAWLKKTNRLPGKLKELEKILREYPYSNFSRYMSDYQACGYPSSSFAGNWYLSPSIGWPNNIQKLVDTELMGLDFLVEYGRQFVAKGNSEM